MTNQTQINNYIANQQEPKCSELRELHTIILQLIPNCKLWFLDGKNSDGKIVANPNIGYGQLEIINANGDSKEFYKIGLSANTTGISVYIFGLKDKSYLAQTYGKLIGKASVSGYCIKFKTLKNIKIEVLKEAILYAAFKNE